MATMTTAPADSWVYVGEFARELGVSVHVARGLVDRRVVASRRLPGSRVQVRLEDARRLRETSVVEAAHH